MLDLEFRRHSKLNALLNLKRLILEGALGTLGAEVDGYRGSTIAIHGEGEDDTDAGVVGVGDGLATTEAE